MSTGHALFSVLLSLLIAAAFSAQLVRWLRVLQREHYEPSSMSRFLGRWSSPQVAGAKSPERRSDKRPITLSHVLIILLLVTVLLRADVVAVFVSVAYGLFCPQGLSIKGRTSKLQWTRRLKVTAVLATVLCVVFAVLGATTQRPWLLSIAMLWAVPMMLDISTRALKPYENREAQKFVEQASKRLTRVHPKVIAITGSYGKTSTKNHLFDLLSIDGSVVASPRSFNNRAGLSRAINENLADGTRVFIAEMGTYGPGEIGELCVWCEPDISIITAIGPVHLERMKSLDVIESAKFEITQRAEIVIVNIDDPRLKNWPAKLPNKKIRTAGSSNTDASVRVIVDGASWRVLVDGSEITSLNALQGVQPTNLACAIAGALEVGADVDQLAQRVAEVHAVANRANVLTAASGVKVVDDTFNANPASAQTALKMLASLDVTGRKVVVTPGLIELGEDQYRENLVLGQSIASINAELVVVGRTNVRSLTAGYEKFPQRFDTRDQAVAWVREVLIAGDGVLYLNDLPDHYP